MSQLSQRTLASAFVLSLFALVLVPMGSGSATAAANAAYPAVLASVAVTGPTLPPIPWCGVAAGLSTAGTGPTLPPIPWDGIV